MTYAKDWRSYPPEFSNLVRTAALRKVEIPCADARAAKALEGRLHAFCGTLHRQALKDLTIVELDNLARRVQFKAKAGVLICLPRDLEPDNLLIKNALKDLPPDPLGDMSGIEISPEMREMLRQRLTNQKPGL